MPSQQDKSIALPCPANRCNMNRPICIATIRGVGLDFNPPMAYFETVFAEPGRMSVICICCRDS